jgi:coenzyme F420-reducing hydrogenase alpha subunit
MADLTGRIDIELRRLPDRIGVTIQASRPTAASRLFIGKGVEETAVSLPALFSICAGAQACACASACEAALGLTPPTSIIRLRRMLVDLETVKEHLWRILLDWPRFLDEPPLDEAMSRVMAAYLRLRKSLTRPADLLRPGAAAAEPDLSASAVALDELAQLSEQQVLGTQPSDWLTRIQTGDDLLDWAQSTDTAPARLMQRVHAQGWTSLGRCQVSGLPCLLATDLEPLLSGTGAERFVAEPLWRGEPRETSPFTRRRQRAPVTDLARTLGNALLPRLAAQLLELASLQSDLRSQLGRLDEPIASPAQSPGEGVGIALVPAARGLLIHRVAIDRGRITDGRISDYRILAPTEWNFHPRGVVFQGLAALPVTDADTLARQAGLFVTAVDPCVDYHVTIS